MKSVLVINALLKANRWAERLGTYDTVAISLEKARTLVPDKNDRYLLVTAESLKKLGEKAEGFQKILVDDVRVQNVFTRMHKSLQNYEDIIYLFIDSPLIDIDLVKKMESLHREEIAEYTYGEGYPVGITPEIIKVNLLPKLVSLLQNDNSEIQRDSLFKALSKEINSFDIETYFASHNQRSQRLELTTSEKRNALLVQRIIEKQGAGCTYEQLYEAVKESPALVRTVPSWVEIEITNLTEGKCIYSPLPFLKRERGQMSFEDYKTIFNKVVNFSGSLYISFSLFGEPLLHRDLRRIIEYTAAHREVHLVLETDGKKFTPDFSDYLSGLPSDNLSVIFQVDAVRKETYARFRGDSPGKVERNIRYFLSRQNDNVYVQMVRMDDNEDELLQFFDIWEKEGAQVIIQKYNSYIEYLPPLSGSDLRPLERMPCWHLLRDMVVYINGDVPRCKQDINGRFLLGNLVREEAADVWKRGECFYLEHCKGKYDHYCTLCDEYYTFNF